MLELESRTLEHWRKKYLGQFLIVLLITGLVVYASLLWFDYIGFIVLMVIFAILILFLTIKALKEDLQARGEGIILAKAGSLFSGLTFDYGKGLKENLFYEQNIIPEYKVRECYNVLYGCGYCLEEDFFYSAISTKFLTIHQTAFEGIVLMFDDADEEFKTKGEVQLLKNKITYLGGIDSLLRNDQATAILMKIMTLFHSKQIQVFVFSGKMFFLIKTKTKLFYQFSIFKYNALSVFVKRVQEIQKAVEALNVAIHQRKDL